MIRSRAWLLAATLVLAAIVPIASAAESSAGKTSRYPGTSFDHKLGLGAYIPDASWRPSRIDAFTRLIGRPPVIISFYKPWTEPPFVHSELNAAWRRGAVPMVTWEPWSWHGPVRRFSLRAVIKGRDNAYVRRAARAAASWGHPILVRFAHEMNGTWYPWGFGRDDNTPKVYKRAWRHVVRLFRRAGAHNVQWVWAPNANQGNSHPFKAYYPGDGWVDWVGLDGFNWASRGEWTSFTRIFASSYDELRELTDRPVIITETASNQSGGDKAAWVSSAMLREIPRFPAIRAVVWFDEPFNGVDARVNSSPAALRAFKAAADTPRYGLDRRELLSTPHDILTPSLAPAGPSGDYGQPSLFYRLTQKLHGRYLWIAVGIGVALVAALVGLALMFRAYRRSHEGLSS